MSRVVRPRVGYTDLCQQPEDGRRYEIYDGGVFVVPSPLPLHQVVADNVAEVLRRYAAEHGGIAFTAPLDIVFSEYNVLQPDVVFFSAARRNLVKLREPIRESPDLVVEVLSLSTEGTDRGRKLQTFARFGVPEYWIIDPEARSIEILNLQGDAYALTRRGTGPAVVRSATLPQLQIRLAGLIPTED